VTDDDVPGSDRGAEVADEPAEELVELVLVHWHVSSFIAAGASVASAR
jgi:hypothetical protein